MINGKDAKTLAQPIFTMLESISTSKQGIQANQDIKEAIQNATKQKKTSAAKHLPSIQGKPNPTDENSRDLILDDVLMYVLCATAKW